MTQKRVNVAALRRREATVEVEAEGGQLEHWLLLSSIERDALCDVLEAASRAAQWGYVTQELVDRLGEVGGLPSLPTRERLDELTGRARF